MSDNFKWFVGRAGPFFHRLFLRHGHGRGQCHLHHGGKGALPRRGVQLLAGDNVVGDGAQRQRPYPRQIETAAALRSYLEGSYLYEPSEGRPLQDPLSFRCVSQVHGAVRTAMLWCNQKDITSRDSNLDELLDAYNTRISRYQMTSFLFYLCTYELNLGS